MTTKTQRRIMVCLAAVALALPAETILLKAVETQDPKRVASDWVATLSADQIQAASGQVQAYPFQYRRAIMRALTPDKRAAIWRRHIVQYVDDHADLDRSTKALLYNAASLATESEFAKPTDEVRAQISLIGKQVSVLLGREEAFYLFYRLGARDGTFASREPVADRLATYIRNVFVVRADEVEGCDCSTSFGCDSPSHCAGDLTCTKDEDWPMCGWFWDQTCDGLCAAGFEGGD